jgi:hypothetical protein
VWKTQRRVKRRMKTRARVKSDEIVSGARRSISLSLNNYLHEFEFNS